LCNLFACINPTPNLRMASPQTSAPRAAMAAQSMVKAFWRVLSLSAAIIGVLMLGVLPFKWRAMATPIQIATIIIVMLLLAMAVVAYLKYKGIHILPPTAQERMEAALQQLQDPTQHLSAITNMAQLAEEAKEVAADIKEVLEDFISTQNQQQEAPAPPAAPQVAPTETADWQDYTAQVQAYAQQNASPPALPAAIKAVATAQQKAQEHQDAQAAANTEGTAANEDAPPAGATAALDGLQLINADLAGINLTGTSVQAAQMIQVNLQAGNLEEAQMQGSYLSHCQLDNARLEEAQLQGSYLMQLSAKEVQAYASQMQGTRFSGAQLQGAKLRAAQLQDAQLDHAQLEGAQLQGAQLQGANLQHANLSGAQMGRHHVFTTNLKGANLSGATGLTQAQINECLTDASTVLPEGLTRPDATRRAANSGLRSIFS